MTAGICDHCGKPQRGSAGMSRGGEDYVLCHPDDGLDCYHLVTVYGEPIGSRRGTV